MPAEALEPPCHLPSSFEARRYGEVPGVVLRGSLRSHLRMTPGLEPRSHLRRTGTTLYAVLLPRRARFLPRRASDGGGEIIRRLRAREQKRRIENESRHAVDAGFLRGIGLARNALDIVVAGEQLPHEVAVHAAFLRGMDQNLAVGQIGALGEVELHQSLFDGG